MSTNQLEEVDDSANLENMEAIVYTWMKKTTFGDLIALGRTIGYDNARFI
jgi:hypothetical protein